MKKYESPLFETVYVTESDIISTSVVIGDNGNNDGGDTSWGDLGGGTVKE